MPLKWTLSVLLVFLVTSLPILGFMSFFVPYCPWWLVVVSTAIFQGLVASRVWTHVKVITAIHSKVDTFVGNACLLGILVCLADSLMFASKFKLSGFVLVSSIVLGYLIGYLAWFGLKLRQSMSNI
ncbi:MAG TPA: hypothetical protein VEA59_02940 [Patescibacteria group bacterium]|nr:hypothetical protein [Patescibacteria group bacterium]